MVSYFMKSWSRNHIWGTTSLKISRYYSWIAIVWLYSFLAESLQLFLKLVKLFCYFYVWFEILAIYEWIDL